MACVRFHDTGHIGLCVEKVFDNTVKYTNLEIHFQNAPKTRPKKDSRSMDFTFEKKLFTDLFLGVNGFWSLKSEASDFFNLFFYQVSDKSLRGNHGKKYLNWSICGNHEKKRSKKKKFLIFEKMRRAKSIDN